MYKISTGLATHLPRTSPAIVKAWQDIENGSKWRASARDNWVTMGGILRAKQRLHAYLHVNLIDLPVTLDSQ